MKLHKFSEKIIDSRVSYFRFSTPEKVFGNIITVKENGWGDVLCDVLRDDGSVSEVEIDRLKFEDYTQERKETV